MGRKRQQERRATTLSVSLTRELAEAVAARVRSGFYTSASELVREALRTLLRIEHAERVGAMKVNEQPPPYGAARFAAAMELFDVGVMAQATKLRQETPDLTEAEVQARLQALDEEQEAGAGLRIAPERLERLRLRGKG